MSDPAPAPDGQTTRFSFACFPAERVAILAGMVAGPGVAVALLQRLVQASARQDLSWLEAISRSGPDSRLFAGASLLLALAVVIYGALYLQWRAGASLEVSARGFRWRRRAVLPGGLLGARIQKAWSDVGQVALVERRSLLGRQALLRIEWPGGTLRLSVPDAWLDEDGARPRLPQRPPGGWAEHPLVASVLGAWRSASALQPESQAVEAT